MRNTAGIRFPLILLVAIACSGDPARPSQLAASADPLDHTPKANEEAEAMALHISGQLVAPDDLYNEIEHELSRIRAIYGGTVPDLRTTRFVPHWVPGELGVRLTEEATRRYREGTYTDLDSLHAYYRLSEADTVHAFQGKLWIRYFFEGRLHPERLAEAYRAVPSVEVADPNGILSNAYNVYPWTVGEQRTYLFRYGWGDCPAGCMFARYMYVRWTPHGPEYVGSFVGGEDPRPDWWDEAAPGWACFENQPECPQ